MRTRIIDENEIAVIQAAVEWAMWRIACHYGPGDKRFQAAERDLERAVGDLHSDNDGHWRG